MGGGFCLLFSVRLLINIHPPTSENQAFGIRQTLCMRQSGVKSPKCPLFRNRMWKFRDEIGEGELSVQGVSAGTGERSKGILSFLFLVPVRPPQKR